MIFSGSAVALVTPFDKNNEVDYFELKNLIEFQIANGTKAIVILGTTGEASTITNEERNKIIKFSVCVIDKRVPLIVGTGSNSTKIAIENSKKAEELGAPILASIKGYAQASRESRYIATVPGLAIQELMKKNDLTVNDFDLIEINEAFAAVPLVSCLGILGMSKEEMDAKVNVNGGAVAVGHPIGATGARILMTLIYELKRSGKKSGVAAICSGMAQGDAVWVEVE